MLPFKKAKQYLISPFHMEPERVGNFAIEVVDHPAGYKETCVSLRTAFMSGHKITSLLHPSGVRRHYLREFGEGDGKGTLMSDTAQEMIDFAEPIHRMTRLVAPSKVLIGGLGLGYIAHWAHRLGHHVTVVEKEPDIIKLTGKYLPPEVEVIEGDLHEYLKAHDARQWRFAIFDTWYGQSEGTYWSEVVPLRRAWLKAKGKPLRLWCWKEIDEMWPQVHRSTLTQWLYMRGEAPGGLPLPPNWEKAKVSDLWGPHRIFFEGLYAHLGSDPDERLVQMFADLYTRGLGQTPLRAKRWEALWGSRWDEVVAKAEERYAKDQAAQNTAV